MKSKLTIVFLIIIIFILGIFLGVYFSSNNSKQSKIEIQNYNINSTKEMPIVGVDEKGNGLVGIVSVEVKPGSGLVLLNINDALADYLNQLSARTAALVAANYTNTNLKFLDVVYNLKTNASIVEGPSAGAAMTIATIAAIKNRQIKPSVYITGAIYQDGSITNVGSIVEKAKVVSSKNGKLFIIPTSNYILGYKEQKACIDLKKIKYCEIKYVQDNIDLSKYLGVNVQQVKNIYEVVNYTIE